MIDRLPVTLALSALLTSATSLPVGRGAKPIQTDPPFLLLQSISATVSGPPLADENDDASYTYQVTCVSGPDPDVEASHGVADQAEWIADKVRKAILGRDPDTGAWLHALTVPGAKVTGRSLDVEPGGTSDTGDAIMTYVLRIRLDLTPA